MIRSIESRHLITGTLPPTPKRPPRKLRDDLSKSSMLHVVMCHASMPINAGRSVLRGG